MKKLPLIALSAIIIVSCNIKPPADMNTDGGLRIVLEPSIADIICSMQSSDSDTIFSNALTVAQKEKNANNSFVDLFISEIKKNDSLHPLSSHFISVQNKPLTDAELIKVLKAKIKETVEEIKRILAFRIDQLGLNKPFFQSLNDDEKIQVEFPGVQSSKRICKLLQVSANLEFFETCENNELGRHFIAADEHLFRLLQTRSDTVIEKDTMDTEKNNPNSPDSHLKQIDLEAKSKAKSIQDQYPLLSILNPSYEYDRNGQPIGYIKGPVVGFAKVKDTATINRYLNNPKIKLHFPATKFLWVYKPISSATPDIFQLIAIRTNRTGKAPLYGSFITNTRISNDDHGPSISIFMNQEAAFIWQDFTKKNIGNAIAVVVDDQVYSFPIVMSEISGGVSSIAGNFTEEEAADLANVIKVGKLPVRLRILSEEVIPPVSAR